MADVQTSARRADDPDGSVLLTSPEVGDLLSAVATHGGGSLVDWRLDHVDSSPNRLTTATFAAVVDWPMGRRDELFGASVRAGGHAGTDENAVIFADGEREVAVWLYPRDPDLPGLIRAAFSEDIAELLNEHQVVRGGVKPEQVSLQMVGYRPRRRAVLRAEVATAIGTEVFFIKVMREPLFAATVRRHELLLLAGIPAPHVVCATDDFLLVLRELKGQPLARAMFDAATPCTAEQLVGLLDGLPAEVAALERRPPWVDAVDQYADMISAAMPALAPRLTWLVGEIRTGLGQFPEGNEPTHGDFHEGQLFVDDGRVSGVLDIDTIGPGRRADDLACLLAHLSTVQRMNPEQAARVSRLIQTWVPVFDTRVDPIELRLRAAGVIISLATGPYRSQEPHWEAETDQIIRAAEHLVFNAR